MKRDESGGIAKAGEQAGQIAVSSEDFGVADDLRGVEFSEQVVRSIAATCAEDGADVVAREHVFERADAALQRSRKIEIAIKNRVVIDGPVAQVAEGAASLRKQVAIDVARGSDNTDGVARTQCRRLDARLLGMCGHRKHNPTRKIRPGR